tara:strand:- start:4782 stop:5498 length:717 start_codon:yes stop_codon:yes gene_type:complete
MFELNKEHDITVVTEIGPENRSALIVDNFYQNPEEVRKYAIGSTKHSKASDPQLMSGLPGHRVWEEDKRIRQNLKPFFDGIRNHKDLWRSPKNIRPGSWENSWDRAAFVCNVMRANHRDPGGGIPHIDSFNVQFGVVIYLNTPEECQGGTKIYANEGIVNMCIQGMDDDTNQVNELASNRWKKDYWTLDCPNSSWKTEVPFDMKWNRCIIYEADNLHGIWHDEGMFTDHDRIAQVLFL